MGRSTYKNQATPADPPSGYTSVYPKTDKKMYQLDDTGTESLLGSGGTPAAHAASHTDGTDDIQDATDSQKGLATAAQVTKLDGIEAAADVTDAINVAAAGAEMTANKNAANGYPGLSAGSKLIGSQQTYGTGANIACEGDDSRLSDSRAPSGTANGDLSGTYPNPTVDDGADSTAIHNNVSAEINAVAAKATPTTSDLLLIEDAADSNAKKKITIGDLPGGGGASYPEFQFFGYMLDFPLTADWAVNDHAGLAADSNNSAFSVRLFDDTIETGVGFELKIPVGATNIKFTFLSRAETAPVTTDGVALLLYRRDVPDNLVVPSWSSGYQMTALSMPTNEYWQVDAQTIALSTLGLTADRTTQFELVRDTIDGGDDLSGNWALYLVKVNFS